MYKPRYLKFFSHLLLLAVIFSLIANPTLVAAKTLYDTPEASGPSNELMDSLSTSGEAYIDQISQTFYLSVGLMKSVAAINAASADELSEELVAQARQDALAAADASAAALGAIDDLGRAVDTFTTEYPVAIDVQAEVDAGLPEEMRTDLQQEAGLTTEQIDALQAETIALSQARLSVASQGLPAELEQQLLQSGFTQAEVDQLEQVVAQRGLANGALGNSMAQFRSTQDELANVRSRMLILSVQLLVRQVAVRQAHGLTPRVVTDAELEELAADELRLLTHVAHLQALWGRDPNLQSGEGDWWFIEHYAGRMAQRLETLVLESQNLGLVLDLYLAQAFQRLAISARSGDADYVKTELDSLAVLLSTLAGNAQFVEQQRSSVKGFNYWAARVAALPALRDWVTWPVDVENVTQAVDGTRQRMDLAEAMGLTAPFGPGGAFEELNEDNNILALVFVAGLPYFGQLAVDILHAAMDILDAIASSTVCKWITAIVTGDTDDPVLLLASIAFSMIPVIGALPDIYSLVTDPDVVMKVLSLIGIIGSIGDLIALIPGAQAVLGATFLGIAASKVMKVLYKGMDVAAQLVLKALRFSDIFKIIGNVLAVMLKTVSSLGSSLDEVIQFVRMLLTGTTHLWDDFAAFARRVGSEMLVELGFDEGSWLAGKVIRMGGDNLSDDVVRSLTSIGNDLADAGVDLSSLTDEAAEGLGDLGRRLDGEDLELFVDGVRQVCPIGILSPVEHPDASTGCDDLISALSDLAAMSEKAKEGIRLLTQKEFTTDFLGTLYARYVNKPGRAQTLFESFGHADNAVELFAKYLDDVFMVTSRYGDEGVAALSKPSLLYPATRFNPAGDVRDFGPEFVEFLRGMPDTEEADALIRSYLNAVNQSGGGLALIRANEGYEIVQIAGKYDVDLYIAGRLSDTVGEVRIRGQAYDALMEYVLPIARRDGIPIPLDIYDSAAEKLPEYAAWADLLDRNRPFVAADFHINPHQVKISSGTPECDAFIHIDQWSGLAPSQRAGITADLQRVFGLSNIDFYQLLSPKPYAGWPDPLRNIPTGSIQFTPYGEILHVLFGGFVYASEFEWLYDFSILPPSLEAVYANG